MHELRLPQQGGLADMGSGAIAGLLATGPMTALILLGQGLGLLRTPPPAQIHKNALRRGQGRDSMPTADPPERIGLSWLASHFGFGAGCGAIYGLVNQRLPVQGAALGTGYGLLIWAINYGGALPMLRIYPKPAHDSATRQAVMIAAHAVFGLALATIDRQLTARRVGESASPA